MHITIKITLWTLAALVLLLTGTFLYLRNADLSTYETQIEGALSEALGHDLQIDGLFNLRVGNLTRVTAEEISITNTEWAENPQLLKIGRLSVTVDLWSLLSSPVIIEDLEVRDAQIMVATNSDNAVNWATGDVPGESAESDGFDPNLIAFKEVRLQNVEINYNDPDRKAPLTLNLDNLTINPDAADVLDLDLQGALNQYPLSGDGKISPWQNLIAGRNLTTDISLSLGQMRLKLQGSIVDPAKLEEVRMNLSMEGPAAEHVTNIFGLPPFAKGPFRILADARKIDDVNELQLSAMLGDIEIAANGNIDHFLTPKIANLDFSISGPDALYVSELFGIQGAPQVPFQMSGDLLMNELRFEFSETRIQLGENNANVDGWLDLSKSIPDGDITVSASGPNLAVIDPFIELHGIPNWDFNVSGRIQKLRRRVHFQNFTASLGPNQIEANGAIDPQTDNSEIFVSIAGPDISFIQSLAELPDVPKKPFSLSAFLRPDSIGINLDEAKLIVGDNQLDIDGVIGTIDGADGTRISLHGFGPELLNISLLTGIPYVPAGEYDYTADIGIDDEILKVDKFDLSVVGANATATGTVNIGASPGDFELQLTASSDDVSQLELFESLKQLDGEALQLDGRIAHRSGIYALTAVTADIGNLGIAVNGQFDSNNATAKLEVDANAPDSELLDRFLGERKLPDGALNVSGQIEKSAQNIAFSDTSFRVGDYSVLLDGTLSNSPLSNNSDLNFSVSGPNYQVFGEMLGIGIFPAKSFSIAAEINGIPTGFVIENLDANVGENDIAGQFTADLRGKPRVTGSLSASFLDIASQLTVTAESQPVTDAESGPFVIPDEPLPLTWMNAFDAKIDLRADRLLLTRMDVKDFEIGVEIRDGALRADPISLGELNGKVSGHLYITPTDDTYALDTLINIENIHVGIMGSAGDVRTALPALNGRIDIKGKGSSVHEIMAGSNGTIALSQGPGRTSSLFVSWLFGDVLTQIIHAINPLAKTETHTTLECAFYELTLDNGLASLDNLVMQSNKVTMAAEGSINFVDEALKLSVSAIPRKGFGISVGGIANSFLNVRGTLKEPSLGIDATGSVTTAGAAVATGGLSLIATGLWNRVNAEKSICDQAEN